MTWLMLGLFAGGVAILTPLLQRDMQRADDERRRREWERAHPEIVALRLAVSRAARAFAQIGASVEIAGRRIREHFEKAGTR